MARAHAARSTVPALAAAVALLLVAALAIVFWPHGDEREVTAEFPRAVALYQGSLVKILGVTVGEVDSVKPAGDRVIVKLHYDGKQKVPSNAKAVVISPSIVGDRFVQLTPAFKTGDTQLPDHAHLGLDRTATPLELDDIFGSLNNLTVALGPNGANAPDASGKGALTRLLDTTARNFGGQGVQFNKTLTNLGKLTETLYDNKDELFSTVTQVEQFTHALSANDDTIRRFNDSLASGAGMLAGERQELGQVLTNLGIAMQEVRGFVRDNKTALGQNITGLERISRILVKNRHNLDEILRTVPVAAENLVLAGNVPNTTLDTRVAMGETVSKLTTNPGTYICAILGQYCSGQLAGLLNLIKAPARTAPFGANVRVVEPVDRTLGGLVEVDR